MTVAIDIHFAVVFITFDVRTLTQYVRLFVFTAELLHCVFMGPTHYRY